MTTQQLVGPTEGMCTKNNVYNVAKEDFIQSSKYLSI